MVMSVAAPQAKGKYAEDNIFGANNRANALAEKIGVDNVINGTVGSILDEEGQLVMLHVVQEAYKALTPKEIVAYAPIQGYPDYLEAVIDQCFGQSRPNGYIQACATSGGSGVLHHIIRNPRKLPNPLSQLPHRIHQSDKPLLHPAVHHPQGGNLRNLLQPGLQSRSLQVQGYV